MNKRRKSREDRFWNKILLYQNLEFGSDCWIWIGSKSRKNLIFPIEEKGKYIHTGARRFAWELKGMEKIPKGRELWNICGNPLCVSPYHQMINTLENRFWRNIKIEDINECWVWTGDKNENDYGRISGDGRTLIKAHRLSWEIHYGDIPKGLCVCHHCDNPSCVNPKHLFVGTHDDNMKDAKRKGRIRRGEESGNSKLCADDVRMIRALHKIGFTQMNIGKMFGVGHSAIGSILTGRTWGWVD